MNISFETQGFDTYLVCTIGDNQQLDTAAIGMLTNNRIQGISPTVFTRFDGVGYLKYLVTAKTTAACLFAGTVSKRGLLDFFSSLCVAVRESSEYMLDANRLIWDMNYIFVDPSSFQAEMIYLPMMDVHGNTPDIVGFFRNIIMSSQYGESEDKNYIGEIISYLSVPASFSPDGFEKLLLRLKGSSSVVQATPLSNPPLRQQETPVQQVNPPFNQFGQPFGNLTPLPQGDEQNPLPPVRFQPQDPVPVVTPLNPQVRPLSAEPEEETISLFYLLQHYNAQNKAIYDAQKKRKKEAAQLNPSKKQKLDKQKNKNKDKNKAESAPSPFAIPGQSAHIPVVAQLNNAGSNPQPPEPYVQPPTPPMYPSPPNAPVCVLPGVGGGAKLNFGDTFYMDEDSPDNKGTLLIDMPLEQKHAPQLVRQRNNECIPINKPLFRFGRESNYADYVIGGNRYIGSAHCHILSRNQEYFIVDDNSKNHTYIDGAMIPGNTEVKIIHGTKIRMADEEFEFRLY